MNIKNVLSPTQRSNRSSSWPDVEPWAHAPVSLHSRGQTHLTVGRKKKKNPIMFALQCFPLPSSTNHTGSARTVLISPSSRGHVALIKVYVELLILREPNYHMLAICTSAADGVFKGRHSHTWNNAGLP